MRRLIVLAILAVVLAPVTALARGATEATNHTLIGVNNIDPSETKKFDSLLPSNQKVRIIGTFIAWGNGADPGRFASRVRHDGYIPLITWESWKVHVNGTNNGGKLDPKYSNAMIAKGKWDPWLKVWAKELHGQGLVYLRFDHEMNGYWYPWSHDPTNYRRMWRHVRTIFRHYAPNVKFIWAPNSSWTTDGWMARNLRYWPGSRYVDYVGVTSIEQYQSWTKNPDHGPQIYLDDLAALRNKFPTIPQVLPELTVTTLKFANAVVDYANAHPEVRMVSFLEGDKFPSVLSSPDLLKVFSMLK